MDKETELEVNFSDNGHIARKLQHQVWSQISQTYTPMLVHYAIVVGHRLSACYSVEREVSKL